MVPTNSQIVDGSVGFGFEKDRCGTEPEFVSLLRQGSRIDETGLAYDVNRPANVMSA